MNESVKCKVAMHPQFTNLRVEHVASKLAHAQKTLQRMEIFRRRKFPRRKSAMSMEGLGEPEMKASFDPLLRQRLLKVRSGEIVVICPGTFSDLNTTR